jgi:hypothetical protein
MTEKGGLRQNFGVEKRRCRLQRDCGKLVQSVDPARRMHIAHRNREDQSPHHPAEQSNQVSPVFFGTDSDCVIALVDSFQKRLEMTLVPRFLRGRHEHKGQRGPLDRAC